MTTHNDWWPYDFPPCRAATGPVWPLPDGSTTDCRLCYDAAWEGWERVTGKQGRISCSEIASPTGQDVSTTAPLMPSDV
jgi:hypothetical protein